MRLTLRTLLAWLDDTLQPTQVREIGVQVAGSPFAQELERPNPSCDAATSTFGAEQLGFRFDRPQYGCKLSG